MHRSIHTRMHTHTNTHNEVIAHGMKKSVQAAPRHRLPVEDDSATVAWFAPAKVFITFWKGRTNYDFQNVAGSGRRARIEYCSVVSSWTRRGFLTNHCSQSEVSFLLGQCFYNYRLAAPNQTLHPITIFWVWLFFFFTCSSEDDFIEALVLSEPPPNATRPLWSHWNLWDRSDGSFSRWICGRSGLKY